jgi:hypothetical protein
MRRLAALSLGLLLAAPVVAGTLAGVTMPDTVKLGDQQLMLDGMGLRSKFGFKVYVGGLYLPDKETDPKKVLTEDETRQMVMHWVRDVDKGKICEGWDEGLEANTPHASPEIKKNFEALCGLMPDAKSGDNYTFTYLPGQGVEVAINDQVKGKLGAKPFADALLACWIGPHPGPGEEFREALMGKH